MRIKSQHKLSNVANSTVLSWYDGLYKRTKHRINKGNSQFINTLQQKSYTSTSFFFLSYTLSASLITFPYCMSCQCDWLPVVHWLCLVGYISIRWLGDMIAAWRIEVPHWVDSQRYLLFKKQWLQKFDKMMCLIKL